MAGWGDNKSLENWGTKIMGWLRAIRNWRPW